MSRSKVLSLAVPMILSNITVPLLGLVDTAVLGHLSHPYYLAGVGIAVTIFNMLFWTMGFLRMSTTGIAAQAFGRRDFSGVRVALLRGLLVAFLMGAALIVFQGALLHLSFFIIHPTAIVAKQAAIFFHIVIWGSPATLANLVILAVLISMHKPRAVLLVTVIMNSVGIILDLVLVLGLGMKTTGVAISTLSVYYLGLAIGLWLLSQLLKRFPGEWCWSDVLRLEPLKHFFSLNRDIFIRTICLVSVFTYFTREGAQYGQWILAANIVLMNFQTFFALAADGFANAAEVLVGRSIGSRDHEALRHSIIECAWWSLIISVATAIIYFIFSKSVIHLLTNIHSIRLVASHYVLWVILLPIFSIWGFLFDGIFIGASMAKEMRNTMILALLTFVVFKLLFFRLGNHGLWLAFSSFMFARGLFMFVTLLRSQKMAAYIRPQKTK